ncbi:hypothetical protein [Ectopseudomonas oleovorans]|nr:hypothetical protein [Pseudomonas oleovorans]
MEEKLFLLQQLSCASQVNAEWKSKCLTSQKEENWQFSELENELDQDFAFTETLVSNYMIDIAVKTRIFQDYFKENHFECGFSQLEKSAIEYVGGDIGSVIVGDFALTLRESCNKIIHAKKFKLLKSHISPSNSFWSGVCELQGDFNKNEWQVNINVKEWAASLWHYHENLAEERESFWADNES